MRERGFFFNAYVIYYFRHRRFPIVASVRSLPDNAETDFYREPEVEISAEKIEISEETVDEKQEAGILSQTETVLSFVDDVKKRKFTGFSFFKSRSAIAAILVLILAAFDGRRTASPDKF